MLTCTILTRWGTSKVWAAGAGPSQVMNAEYARKGRTNVFPNKGKDYGYTLWREEGVLPGTYQPYEEFE